MFVTCLCCYLWVLLVTICVTGQNDTQFACVSRSSCSVTAETDNSKYITCSDGQCVCDATCFLLREGRCSLRKCYSYSFGSDTCSFMGRNWRITSILAKYAGFVGGVYFYLGEWVLGVVQLLVFTVTLIAIPVVITIYCVVGYVMLKIGVKLRELYGIVKRVVISVISVCCVHCVFLCVCVIWYAAVMVLVAHNLITDVDGCGMGNEPQFIHIV